MPDVSRSLRLPVACGLLALASMSYADAPSEKTRPIVSAFERFGGGPERVASAGGLLLLGELNCTSCHSADAGQSTHLNPKQAPILDGVGGRVRVDYLRAFLADPHGTKPGTTMPDPFSGIGAIEKAANVEALVHFLATTGRPAEKDPRPSLVAAGKTLFHRVGCVVCHGPREGEMPGSVPLGDLGAKYPVPALSAFLLDPMKVRPSGRMPGLNLSPEEAGQLANYLLKDAPSADTAPNVEYAYYEGDWQKLPDFSAKQAKLKGLCIGLDVARAPREGGFGFRFSSRLPVARDGDYTFHLASDDGSRLSIDGRTVVDNDGVHPMQGKSAATRLAKGTHQVVVDFFQGGGEAELLAEYEGPSVPRQDLATALSLGERAPKAKGQEAAFSPDPALAMKGRELFASVGCASCHQLHEDGRPIAAKGSAKPLAGLEADGGCLAASVPKGLPDYQLDRSQRAALGSAVAALVEPPGAPSASTRIERTMAALNCYACHRRGEVGGVVEARDAYFETTQKEMGDEGRLPPTLDGVGGKLNASYLKGVLSEGAKDRPYMLTRMPRFGEANAGHLAPAFEALDAVEPVGAVEFDLPDRKVKATGRFLVGSQALGCVACHTFKGVQAQGIQAIDMTTMTRRLRRDWFHKYLPDPPALRPGTRMPSGWPMGQSLLPKVLDGDTNRQIESVWRFLEDGGAASVPYGLGRNPIPLVPEGDAIIYRNFIEGAGPRAIAVGYPEGAHIAFDAGEPHLALIWQGAFLDAARHWTDRGEGFQPPLGDNVFALPPGPAFASITGDIKDPAAPWPTSSPRGPGGFFRGYRLGANKKPTFLYERGDIRVEDFPEAVAGEEEPSIRRTLNLSASGPVENVWFRAAVADRIEPAADGWFRLSTGPKMKITSDPAPVLRTSGGKAELLVPIRIRDGRARVVQEIAW